MNNFDDDQTKEEPFNCPLAIVIIKPILCFLPSNAHFEALASKATYSFYAYFQLFRPHQNPFEMLFAVSFLTWIFMLLLFIYSFYYVCVCSFFFSFFLLVYFFFRFLLAFCKRSVVVALALFLFSQFLCSCRHQRQSKIHDIFQHSHSCPTRQVS